VGTELGGVYVDVGVEATVTASVAFTLAGP